MKIAIVGYGYVGKSTEYLFSECETLIHDPDLGYEIDNWSGVDFTFICVPTPLDFSFTNSLPGDTNGMMFSGVSNKIVREAIKSVRGKTTKNRRGGQIVVRSTLGPDQIEDGWIYMPEFLRENSWEKDTAYKTPIIVGSNAEQKEEVETLQSYFPFMKMVYNLTPREAAIYKISRNSFLSMKVMFANHLKSACDKYECDFGGIVDVYKLENEFGKSHWDVPGPDGRVGFGGKCLPKDTLHYANIISDKNMFHQILDDNENTR